MDGLNPAEVILATFRCEKGESEWWLGTVTNFATGYLRNLLILCTREIVDSPAASRKRFAPENS